MRILWVSDECILQQRMMKALVAKEFQIVLPKPESIEMCNL